MKNFFKIRTMAVTINITVAALFCIFFVYLSCAENVQVYSTRSSHAYAVLDNIPVERVQDDTAPAGVRSQYSWKLNFDSNCENCLCFYVSHHYVHVYIDGELVYSLTSQENERIADIPADRWATVPLYPEDIGREITIVLTPVFENVVDLEAEFLLGSHFSILFDQVKQDLPQIFLATLCILLGFFVIFVQMYLLIRRNSKDWEMIFLGIFSILLGLWRMTDIRSAPMLFPANSLVLGHVATASIFLLCCFLPLFTSALFQGCKADIMLAISLISGCVSLFALGAEVFTGLELKETLFLSHVMLILTVVFLLLLMFIRREKSGASVSLMILVSGIVLDMILYYVGSKSAALFCTMFAFIIYVIVTFLFNIMDTSKKAYTDSYTGLFNKTRWLELIHEASSFHTPTCILMIDLNGLKYINDTFGHEAGDKIIFGFANILRNTLPSSSVICRWGGDEFSVMMTDTDRKNAEKYVKLLRQAAEEYNQTCGEPFIHFAVGFALSTEHPGLNREELMRAADDCMYQDKLAWYRNKMIDHR